MLELTTLTPLEYMYCKSYEDNITTYTRFTTPVPQTVTGKKYCFSYIFSLEKPFAIDGSTLREVPAVFHE